MADKESTAIIKEFCKSTGFSPDAPYWDTPAGKREIKAAKDIRKEMGLI